MVKILKILKNLIISFFLSALIIFIIILAFDYLLPRTARFGYDIMVWNILIGGVLLFFTSFVFFNSRKDNNKKKSRNLFIILVIYLLTSSFLLTMSPAWKYEKFEVARQKSPLYAASVRGDNFDIFVRWDEDALEFASEYNIPPYPKIGFNSRYCSEGVYEVRLRDNSSVRFDTYDTGSDFVGVDFDDFDNIPGIRSRGKNILLISDPCGYEHQVDVTGYNSVRTFNKRFF